MANRKIHFNTQKGKGRKRERQHEKTINSKFGAIIVVAFIGIIVLLGILQVFGVI